MRLIRRLAMVITMALALGLTGLASVIVITGLRDDVQVSDVGIVLGSKVMADGAPSSRLRARLDRAGALYRQGQFAHVIVSGGTGVEGYSEARVMAHYLTDRYQVPAAAIILDEQGVDTAATARNSAAIMQAHHFTSALVVTQYFHIMRSRYALQQAGIRTVHTAHAHYFDMRDVYSTAREVIALPVYWLHSRP